MGTDTVWFFAPDDVQLDLTEFLFVNVEFTTGTPQTVNFFVAECIMGQVPETAMLALFGLGLAGFGFARRKRMI